VRLAVLVLVLLASASAAAGPTRSSPIAVAPGGASGDVAFVVNPDSGTVARIEFDATHASATPLREATVGRYPRTLALAGAWVFTADQKDDTVSRLAQTDLGGRTVVGLGVGCSPYGVAATPDGGTVLVTCQARVAPPAGEAGQSELVLVDPVSLAVSGRIPLAWPNARAIAIASDGARAYVTHYLTQEPETEAHVSVVNLRSRAVETIFPIPADRTTCETQNSGQGVLNLVSAAALVPDDAPPEVRNQLWVGGTLENNLSKGLFERYPPFAKEPGARLFPLIDFAPFPPERRFPGASAARDKYTASFHDITRFAIFKLDVTTGTVIGKIDVDQANNATDIEFSADGTTAYVVDQMFNSVHILSTRRGQGSDVTTVFASPSAFGPGGADPRASCVPQALEPIVPEAPFRVAPEAELTVIIGHDPVDPQFQAVATGVDFDTPTFMATGVSQMRRVPDGVGTAPIGVRLASDGTVAYVANYLARNVVAIASAASPNLRCAGDFARTCATSNDCLGRSECVPLVLGPPVRSITGGLAADPVPPAILDGKILFNTAARDGSRQNGIGLHVAAPPFDDADSPLNLRVPGSVVSTSQTASYVTCSTCHADFGGQDGRTWDFSQLGSSLRNTMDLRGRSAFAPGHCSSDATVECLFDAACGPGNTCRMREDLIPPNVPAADRGRYFNPMLTVHWNGDRDEVEDFEHTFRSLMGAGDCDGVEDSAAKCFGALVQRSPATSTDPVDVHEDLGAPNRNLPGQVDPSRNVGVRLSHVADFVYSLADFVRNPNPPDAAAERGRRLFSDPQTRCAECHDSAPLTGRQLFTDKRPNPRFMSGQPAGGDRNNPFLRHDVGTGNVFDDADPDAVARASGSFQNAESTPRMPVPRGPLDDYVTPPLNDVWNTRPYLHDGTAHFLLDVIRPCNTQEDDCLRAGRGRNLDDRHGNTSRLTPAQLNDLTAFQKTLTLETVVGVGDRVVNAGQLGLSGVMLVFAKHRAAFRATGIFGDAPAPIDPSHGVTISIATPAGEEMAIVTRRLMLARRGRRFSGRMREAGTSVALRLREISGGRFRFAARIRGRALSTLDTGNRDVTLALEIDGVSFVRNRNLKGRRHVFRLPRRKHRG
jgi:DNA-binding beta-propeller fold protein YncE